MHDFDVVLLEDETGGYVAIVPALPGCHTQGNTLAEVMENVKEAIDLHLETLTVDENKDLLKEKVVGTRFPFCRIALNSTTSVKSALKTSQYML